MSPSTVAPGSLLRCTVGCMATYRFQVTLPYVTGLPADVATNTFYVQCVDDEAANDCAALLATAYNTTEPGAGHAFCYYLSGIVSREDEACSIKVYDMADPEPRPLIAEQSFTLVENGSDDSLPLEVSICTSFRGLGPSAPRERGRVYLGPLSTRALSSSQTADPNTAVIDAASWLAEWFYNEITETPESMIWVVRSSFGTETPVKQGWVDNEFDTQRRRQVEATTRKTWVAP